MCVAFRPYYRQDYPRTAGAMDTFFREALQAYADVTYKDLHDYLARRFHAWYAKFKPASSAVVSAGDPELGEVLPVDGVDGAAPPAKRSRFSLTFQEVSAAPAAPAPLPAGDQGESDKEGASEGGGDADGEPSPTLSLVSLPAQGRV
jgi:hypothetical protein